MTWLGDSHFGSLNPDVVLTSHNVEMKADVIEVCLAAFTGHPDFAHLAPGVDPPGLHMQLCAICRFVHKIDASIRTGWLKWSCEPVETLARIRPDLKDHSFVQAWLSVQHPMKDILCF